MKTISITNAIKYLSFLVLLTNICLSAVSKDDFNRSYQKYIHKTDIKSFLLLFKEKKSQTIQKYTAWLMEKNPPEKILLAVYTLLDSARHYSAIQIMIESNRDRFNKPLWVSRYLNCLTMQSEWEKVLKELLHLQAMNPPTFKKFFYIFNKYYKELSIKDISFIEKKIKTSTKLNKTQKETLLLMAYLLQKNQPKAYKLYLSQAKNGTINSTNTSLGIIEQHILSQRRLFLNSLYIEGQYYAFINLIQAFSLQQDKRLYPLLQKAVYYCKIHPKAIAVEPTPSLPDELERLFHTKKYPSIVNKYHKSSHSNHPYYLISILLVHQKTTNSQSQKSRNNCL